MVVVSVGVKRLQMVVFSGGVKGLKVVVGASPVAWWWSERLRCCGGGLHSGGIWVLGDLGFLRYIFLSSFFMFS
ncbi:hypothetical protein HanIR_Chr16g0825681 [Helianthus annuus]|nr:hypothetical protein HanIR_Chr16g0825681 [Helianthus annuus]